MQISSLTSAEYRTTVDLWLGGLDHDIWSIADDEGKQGQGNAMPSNR